MLSKTALEQFKKIWKEEFKEEISDDLAIEEATNLLSLFNAIYKPVKKEWLDKYEKSN
jgi:predicted Zn-dependent protease with MMP-like domain